ncbi:MAG: glutamine--fructose-6-phosphate transaminase (isomerizing) [Thermoprotei archaeon]|nr:glutamine--fructose-6-phosphate transaminase (isomerizing) [Thermoprotei archaeon]
MCGIIGVCSIDRNIAPMISLGLRRLEYRGYDSVGVAIVGEGGIQVWKAKGDVDSFLSRFKVDSIAGRTGLGHTRWATHGPPNDVNAHPHMDCRGKIAVVHNGVLRNFVALKNILELRGHSIVSETDTELIAHLIEDEKHFSSSFFEAFVRAVSRLEGSYAIAVVNEDEPHRVYFARVKSPLIIGVGNGFNAVASDIPAVIEYTRRIIVLDDGELGWITPGEVKVFKLTDEGLMEVSREEILSRVVFIEWGVEAASKHGYPHFMLKEIVEQPDSVRSTYEGNVSDPVLETIASLLASSDNIIVTGAGTSYHAGLTFTYYLANIAGRHSIPIIASEHRILEGAVGRGDVVVAISQSGETFDTLEAVRAFRRRGARVVGVTNVVGSALSREADIAVYMRAGPEIGVAATKTFTSQIMLLTLISIYTARETGLLGGSEVKVEVASLAEAPNIVRESIGRSLEIISDRELGEHRSAYILGRGLGAHVAKEAALKIKEIAYVHAESYPAGESKHGPIALIDEGFPVYFAATTDSPEITGNIMEMAARGARVVVVKPEDYKLPVGVKEAKTVEMPPTRGDIKLDPYALTPYFQILAYKEAVARGYNPDKPRNLAKTVTVE